MWTTKCSFKICTHESHIPKYRKWGSTTNVPDISERSIKKWMHEKHSHDVIKWPFVRGIHRSPLNSPHKGQLRGALTFSLICAWINGWANTREAGDLRRHRAHYDFSVMKKKSGKYKVASTLSQTHCIKMIHWINKQFITIAIILKITMPNCYRYVPNENSNEFH